MHDDDDTALELDAYVRGIAAAVRELEVHGCTIDADGYMHCGLPTLWADALEVVPTGVREHDRTWTLTGATVLLAYGGPTVRAYVEPDGVRIVGSWGRDRVEHYAHAPEEAAAFLELVDYA